MCRWGCFRATWENTAAPRPFPAGRNPLARRSGTRIDGHVWTWPTWIHLTRPQRMLGKVYMAPPQIPPRHRITQSNHYIPICFEVLLLKSPSHHLSPSNLANTLTPATSLIPTHTLFSPLTLTPLTRLTSLNTPRPPAKRERHVRYDDLGLPLRVRQSWFKVFQPRRGWRSFGHSFYN